VAELFAGVDHILHAGDIGYASIIVELEMIAPVTAVLGNNDAGLPFPETASVELGGVRFVVHHIVNPARLPPPLEDRLRRERAEVVVFGHTHRKADSPAGGRRFLNPGYAGRPRFGEPRSVALFDTVHARVEFLPL
jgi:hypothetical protein